MTPTTKPNAHDWLAALILGIALGTILLGIGGRIAMRVIALVSGVAPGFSFGGSLTVVFLGAVSGAAGGLLLAAARALFPGTRILRGLLFWLLLLALTLRGLRPLDPTRCAVFLPLVGMFGAALQAAWCRISLPRLPWRRLLRA